jgi:hypothetical protein
MIGPVRLLIAAFSQYTAANPQFAACHPVRAESGVQQFVVPEARLCQAVSPNLKIADIVPKND